VVRQVGVTRRQGRCVSQDDVVVERAVPAFTDACWGQSFTHSEQRGDSIIPATQANPRVLQASRCPAHGRLT
jgi:hypothetical protein